MCVRCAYPRKKSQIYSFASCRESERENPKRQKPNNPCCELRSREGHHRQTSPPHACCCRRPQPLTSLGHATPAARAWFRHSRFGSISNLVFFFFFLFLFLSYFVLIYCLLVVTYLLCYFVSCLEFRQFSYFDRIIVFNIILFFIHLFDNLYFMFLVFTVYIILYSFILYRTSCIFFFFLVMLLYSKTCRRIV